jgi:hypothetical protein
MVEIIAPGNYEALAVTWLTGKLGTGVAIHSKVPKVRPPVFAKVIRTGGHRLDLAYYEAQLTFECWGPDEDQAGALAVLAYGHMFALAGDSVSGIFVRRVIEVGGIVNSQDPESQQSRYVFTLGVQARMSVIA